MTSATRPCINFYILCVLYPIETSILFLSYLIFRLTKPELGTGWWGMVMLLLLHNKSRGHRLLPFYKFWYGEWTVEFVLVVKSHINRGLTILYSTWKLYITEDKVGHVTWGAQCEGLLCKTMSEEGHANLQTSPWSWCSTLPRTLTCKRRSEGYEKVPVGEAPQGSCCHYCCCHTGSSLCQPL